MKLINYQVEYTDKSGRHFLYVFYDQADVIKLRRSLKEQGIKATCKKMIYTADYTITAIPL